MTAVLRRRLPLLLFGGAGCLVICLFPGSPEQDSGYHYQMTRAVFEQPEFLVKVWARPLFTAAFALPAQAGLLAARGFALLLAWLLAWQTIRLGEDLQIPRSRWLLPALLLAQPVFFVFFTDLLTEPIFALLFVVALRWHIKGRKVPAMLAASFLPLARPEGFFLCLLWGLWGILGCWYQTDGKGQKPAKLAAQSSRQSLLLAGFAIWWCAAWAMTGDSLYILHNWPHQWRQDVYGRGGMFSYTSRMLEAVGFILIVPLLAGFWATRSNRTWMPIVSAWLTVFGLHSVLRYFGMFGEAGYPRYMVTVAPATALITLAGWNHLEQRMLQSGKSPTRVARTGVGVLAFSIFLSFIYFDQMLWAQDSVAIQKTMKWVNEHGPKPVRLMIWSNVDMCQRTQPDYLQSPIWGEDREENLKLLRSLPEGTLAVWDNHYGPTWHKIDARDIEAAGFTLFRTEKHRLTGMILPPSIIGERVLELSILYKPIPGSR